MSYGYGAADEVLIIDDAYFSNTDTAACALTSCSLHAEDDCGGSALTSSEITFTDPNAAAPIVAARRRLAGT